MKEIIRVLKYAFLSCSIFFGVTFITASIRIDNTVYFGIYGLEGLIITAVIYLITVFYSLKRYKSNRLFSAGIVIGALIGIVLNLTFCYFRAANTGRMRLAITHEQLFLTKTSHRS